VSDTPDALVPDLCTREQNLTYATEQGDAELVARLTADEEAPHHVNPLFVGDAAFVRVVISNNATGHSVSHFARDSLVFTFLVTLFMLVHSLVFLGFVYQTKLKTSFWLLQNLHRRGTVQSTFALRGADLGKAPYALLSSLFLDQGLMFSFLHGFTESVTITMLVLHGKSRLVGYAALAAASGVLLLAGAVPNSQTFNGGVLTTALSTAVLCCTETIHKRKLVVAGLFLFGGLLVEPFVLPMTSLVARLWASTISLVMIKSPKQKAWMCFATISPTLLLLTNAHSGWHNLLPLQ
jgi:hypothetical protein